MRNLPNKKNVETHTYSTSICVPPKWESSASRWSEHLVFRPTDGIQRIKQHHIRDTPYCTICNARTTLVRCETIKPKARYTGQSCVASTCSVCVAQLTPSSTLGTACVIELRRPTHDIRLSSSRTLEPGVETRPHTTLADELHSLRRRRRGHGLGHVFVRAARGFAPSRPGLHLVVRLEGRDSRGRGVSLGFRMLCGTRPSTIAARALMMCASISLPSDRSQMYPPKLPLIMTLY